jgi:hypothetical protein
MGVAGAFAVARRGASGRIVIVWAVIAVATTLRYAPLYIKVHFEPLLFALVVLAGAGAEIAWRAPRARESWPTVAAVLAAATLYLAELPHVLDVDRGLIVAQSYENDGAFVSAGTDGWRKQARKDERLLRGVSFLVRNGEPGRYVLTDHQIIAFMARRQLPPEVAVINSRAVDIGALGGQDLIHATERHGPPAVLVWDAPLFGDPYIEWLSTSYELAEEIGGSRGYVLRR